MAKGGAKDTKRLKVSRITFLLYRIGTERARQEAENR